MTTSRAAGWSDRRSSVIAAALSPALPSALPPPSRPAPGVAEVTRDERTTSGCSPRTQAAASSRKALDSGVRGMIPRLDACPTRAIASSTPPPLIVPPTPDDRSVEGARVPGRSYGVGGPVGPPHPCGSLAPLRDARAASGARRRSAAGGQGGCSMSSDPETTRVVRSWLGDGVTVLPGRVLDAVIDQLPATPQRRAPWPARRLPEMNTAIKLALGAAAVMAVSLLGLNLLDGPAAPAVGGASPAPSASPSPSPSPDPTPGSTPAPTPSALPADGRPCPLVSTTSRSPRRFGSSSMSPMG